MSDAWLVERTRLPVSDAWLVKRTRLPVRAILDNADDDSAEQTATEIFDGVTSETVRRIISFVRQPASPSWLAPPRTACYAHCLPAFIAMTTRTQLAHGLIHEPDAAMSREEYLAWVEQQPAGRFERIDSIVVATAPDRASHNLRKAAAWETLRRATRDAGLTSCQASTDGMAVRVEDSDFEPDALLRCGPRLPPNTIHAPTP